MYLAVFVIGIVLDRLSKLAVMHNMELYEQIKAIPHVLDLFYVTNSGAAFSLFEGGRVFLIIFTLVSLALLLALWLYARRETAAFRVGVVLVASGAVGNLIDRLLYGKVVDFLQFDFWQSFPVFNIADVLIVVGCAVLLIDILFTERKKRENDGAKVESDGGTGL